jgi:hypothetical protein
MAIEHPDKMSDSQRFRAENKESILAVVTCIGGGIVIGPHEAGASILI